MSRAAATADSGLATFEKSDRYLRKSMGLNSLLFLSIGGIIGSGWLFATLAAASAAGPASVVSWVLGGAFIIVIALAYAEIAAMLPRSGAIVRYPALTHGSFTGWLMGWAYFLSAVSVPAIEAEAVVTYLGGRFPQAGLMTTEAGTKVLTWPNGILSGIALMVLFFILNFFGIRLLGEWNRWFTWWKLVIPIATFVLLFSVFDSTNYSNYGGFAPMGVAPIFQALATSGIVFAYLGFRQALDFGGESRRPQRDIPLATIGSVVITMVIYVLLQLAFTGAINWHAVGVNPGDWAKLASSAWASGPLYHELIAANIALLGAFATVLLIDAAISPSGTGWIYMGTSIRSFYGLAVPGYLPRLFRWMNRFGIPWIAAFSALVVGCIFFIPAPSWYLLVGFITSATVLTYIMGGLMLPVLRRHAAELRRPFRLGWSALWAPLGFLAALMITYWSGFTTLDNVYAAVFVGLPLFSWFYVVSRGWANPIASGVWGLAFLAGWVYVNHMGGWTLSQAQVAGSWSFPVYYAAFAGSVLVYTGGLWLMCSTEGRRHVQSGFWLVVLLLATFLVSYYGEFGPVKNSPLRFPWGSLIEAAMGLFIYYWGVASGFATAELGEIVAGGEAAQFTSVPSASSPAAAPHLGRRRISPT